MKKLISKILPVVILLLGVFIILSGCEKKKDEKKLLKNTEWELVSIFIVEKDSTVTDFKYENCNDCYRFKFDTDSTAIGKSISNQLNLTLSDNNKASCATTKIFENNEKANLYCEAIIQTEEYILNDNTLYLNSANHKIILKKSSHEKDI